MYRSCLLLFALVCLAGCSNHDPDLSDIDGVYMLCSEVRGFSGEILELKDGKFRYWFSSDVGVADSPKYPLTGKFSTFGSKLKLENKKVYSPVRTFGELNGIKIIWRDDGLDYWKKTKQIAAYSVLIRSSDAPFDEKTFNDEQKYEAMLPKLRSLYTAEMYAEDAKKFGEVPLSIRKLIQLRESPLGWDIDIFNSELDRVRGDLKPEVFNDLIRVLATKYQESGIIILRKLIDETPSNLNNLISAMKSVPHKDVMELALLILMDAIKVTDVDLEIPNAGVRIALHAGKEIKSSLQAIEGNPNAPQRADWADRLDVIIPECQKWCREQLAKRVPAK